jgi:hypothetical protein
MPDLAERLRAQNNGTAWRRCEDRGRRHRWVRTKVDPTASPRTLAREAEAGYFTCARPGCPAARFGYADEQHLRDHTGIRPSWPLIP